MAGQSERMMSMQFKALSEQKARAVQLNQADWMHLNSFLLLGVPVRFFFFFLKDKCHSNAYVQNLEKMGLKNLFTGQQWRNRHRE